MKTVPDLELDAALPAPAWRTLLLTMAAITATNLPAMH